jgi:beta-galactosidase
MILRDRNHPSIVIWSVGNEIPERGDAIGLQITKQLVAGIRKNDSSRPITAAINPWLYSTPKHPWEYAYPIFEELDIAGNNYNWPEWEKYHQKYPEIPVMITESYPIEMNTVWEIIEKTPWAIGDFVWTSVDYLGEAGVGTSGLDNETNYMAKYGNFIASRTWPWFNAWCGDIDLIGNKKMQSYYRDVVWNRSPMVIAVHTPIPEGRKELISKWGWPDELISWTWPGEEGKALDVTVYSKCTSVRLELNGKVIGEEKVKNDPVEAIKPLSGSFAGVSTPLQLSAKFRVPYAAGELKAIGITDGKEVATQVLKTAGAPKKLILTAERNKITADRNDLAYITVEVADENGNVIPNANLPYEVEVAGNGELAATGNACPNEMESFQDKHSKLFHGKAVIIVRPFDKSGKIKITANSKGVASKTIEINVKD